MQRWVLVILLAFAARAHADDPKLVYQKFELANGMRVYVLEDHKAPLVHEVMWARVGSKDELAHHTGFAHLFEHLMFKGSAHLPDGLMDRLLEAAGGWSDASTSSDATVYENVATSSFLEQVLWIEADRIAGLTDTLDQAKLDNQRDVVLNERRQSVENQPYGMADLVVAENLWPADYAYHWPPIGHVADIRAAALDDVRAFFEKYYVPNNLTMVIAGDVTLAQVKPLVTRYFAWIPRAPEPVRPTYKAPAALAKSIEVTTTDDVKVPRVYIAWRAPAAYSHDEPAVDVAASILGGGKSSRLYKRLVYAEKIAQDVSAYSYSEELAGEVEVVVTAKPGVDPKRLLREVSDEVARLAAGEPEAGELERASNSHEAEFLSGLESTLSRAQRLAEYDVLAHDPDFFAKDLARYRAVTAADVRAATATYLLPKARVVLTVNPGKKVRP
ncbi:MAG TPA: pitrilysin family protein [Kofleriaceae bacterium]|nr:pitrilysin family protein [Kofleriaceae bacterium]